MTSGGRNSNLSENRKQLKMAKSSHQDTWVTMTIIDGEYGKSRHHASIWGYYHIRHLINWRKRHNILNITHIFLTLHFNHVEDSKPAQCPRHQERVDIHNIICICKMWYLIHVFANIWDSNLLVTDQTQESEEISILTFWYY